MGPQVIAVAAHNVVLPRETRVCIFGLSTSAQYNGKWGKITDFTQSEDKYTIQLSAAKSIKVARAKVRASG